MFDEILRKANELLNRSEPFALAVVVRREAPISGRPGDKAVIQADGTIAGWIGGGCTQPVVIKEAQNAIKDGKPRFVRVTPSSSTDHQEGIVEYNMTCHSGGTIDVYIEPVLPQTHLIILGKSPVAQTLAQLGGVLHYRVSVFAPNSESGQFPNVHAWHETFDLGEQLITPQTYVVVSTQGQDDEEALQSALRVKSGYIAFVASRKKAQAVFEYLKGKGVSEAQLAAIKVPAGLDIKAHVPEEIAVSILAEIIRIRNSASPQAAAPRPQPAKSLKIVQEAAVAIDPICGMSVDIGTAKHRSEFQGQTYYFCCAGCKDRFDKQPEKYLAVAHEA